MLVFYLLAIVSLLVGTAAIYMAMIPVFPVTWLYWHYFLRFPIVYGILIFTFIWGVFQPVFPPGNLRPPPGPGNPFTEAGRDDFTCRFK